MHQHENVAYSAYTGFDKASVLRYMVIGLFMLLMIDNVLTYWGVAYLNGIEGNPLCALLGLEVFIALKVGLALILPPAIYHVGKERIAAGIWCGAFLCVLYAIIAVNNVIRLGLVG